MFLDSAREITIAELEFSQVVKVADLRPRGGVDLFALLRDLPDRTHVKNPVEPFALLDNFD